MQTSYKVNQDVAIEGQSVGHRESRPGLLQWLPQITQIRIANSETGDLLINVVDDKTQQSYDLTVAISGAVEATSLDEIKAAIEANGKFNDLFTVTEDGVDDAVLTARLGNRTYTVTTTPPGSMTAVVSTLQAAGGSGIEFGRFVARGSGDLEIAAVGATTTLADLYGMIFRTEANHFHALENELPSDVDTASRGRTYAIMERGRCMVRVEEAVTPASTPYMRRATTSGAGRVGGLRASPAGTVGAAYTVVPVVDLSHYAFEFGWRGRHYTVIYDPTDATTAVADAIDGLYDAAGGATPPAGLTLDETDTLLTITCADGEDLDYIRNAAWSLDAEAASVVVTNTVAADADAIDVSSICEFETSAAADGYARLRLKM